MIILLLYTNDGLVKDFFYDQKIMKGKIDKETVKLGGIADNKVIVEWCTMDGKKYIVKFNVKTIQIRSHLVGKK